MKYFRSIFVLFKADFTDSKEVICKCPYWIFIAKMRNSIVLCFDSVIKYQAELTRETKVFNLW